MVWLVRNVSSASGWATSLSAARSERRAPNDCLFDNRCDGVERNATLSAVARGKPSFDILGPFAGVATNATQGNIGGCNNSCIIDNVFPTRPRPARCIGIAKSGAAVNALEVSLYDLAFKFRGNIPARTTRMANRCCNKPRRCQLECIVGVHLRLTVGAISGERCSREFPQPSSMHLRSAEVRIQSLPRPLRPPNSPVHAVRGCTWSIRSQVQI